MTQLYVGAFSLPKRIQQTKRCRSSWLLLATRNGTFLIHKHLQDTLVQQFLDEHRLAPGALSFSVDNDDAEVAHGGVDGPLDLVDQSLIQVAEIEAVTVVTHRYTRLIFNPNS